MLSEQGKRLVSMAVTATLCAGLLPASAVVAASPGGPGGPGAGGPPASIPGAGGPPPMLNGVAYCRQHPFQYGAESRKGKGTADFII